MNTKAEEILEALKSIKGVALNNWKSKQREKYLKSKLLNIEWLIDGGHLKKNKDLIKRLKTCYLEYDYSSFTSQNLPSDFYLIHEPFGGNHHPDFLFITPRGIFSIEDKGSDNGKVYWNSSTPRGNKILFYYHQKKQIVYIVSTKLYGWTDKIQREYKEFCRDFIKKAKKEYYDKFASTGISPLISKTSFYARPMLEDKTNVADFYDPEEIDVKYILNTFLSDEPFELGSPRPTPTPTQLSFDF